MRFSVSFCVRRRETEEGTTPTAQTPQTHTYAHSHTFTSMCVSCAHPSLFLLFSVSLLSSSFFFLFFTFLFTSKAALGLENGDVLSQHLSGGHACGDSHDLVPCADGTLKPTGAARVSFAPTSTFEVKHPQFLFFLFFLLSSLHSVVSLL